MCGLGRLMLMLSVIAAAMSPVAAETAPASSSHAAGGLPGAGAVDFDTQVMPLLTRAGCNAGSCHGAAIGRGGFKLSLLGSDAAADYTAIVHQLEGRRVNLAIPEESLVLLKPTNLSHHEGGERIAPGSEAERLMVQWLGEGAQRLERRRLIELAITPAHQVLQGVNAAAELKAVARFDNGEIADVTDWTVFTSADEAAVTIGDDDIATVLRPGQHTIIARYLDRVQALRLVVPIGVEPVDLAAAPRNNFVDDEVLATLATLRLPPGSQADDATFLRRVTLDLTGRLPTPDERRAFLADDHSQKRERLIDRLLASEAFVTYWTLQWAKLLELHPRALQPEGLAAFGGWLRDSIARGEQLDSLAMQMLTANGDGYNSGPVNFSRINPAPRDHAEYVSRVLMGVRLGCANCHDHPLDRWTQDDYHGLAAVFARVNTGRRVEPMNRGEVTHPVTGEPAMPRVPGHITLSLEDDGRARFAEWLTDDDNAYFAQSMVNRLWRHMMGRGLVEPLDDLRATNPASHPRLLERLADDFIEHSYDLRHALRRIALSAAYQRAPGPAPGSGEDDSLAHGFYAHALERPLEAEVLADAIRDVTGAAAGVGDVPDGIRAIALLDPTVASRSLDVLGRCSREGPCDTSAGTSGGGLTRMLHLINGDVINGAITAPGGRLTALLATEASNEPVVESLYELALGRSPAAAERAFWRRQLEGLDDEVARREVFEDLLWALLTSREFMTNH